LFLFVIMLLDLRSFSNIKVSLEFLLTSIMVLILVTILFFFLIAMDLSFDFLNFDFPEYLFDFDIYRKTNIKLLGEVLYNYYYLQVLIVCFYFFIVIVHVIIKNFKYFKNIYVNMKFLYHIFAYTSLGLITFLMTNEITTNFFTNEIDR